MQTIPGKSIPHAIELAVTVLSEALMAATNVLLAWFLVRIFGATGFAKYLTIASLVGVFSIPSLGIQNAFAIGSAAHSLRSHPIVDEKRTVRPITYSVGILTCWIIFIPLAIGPLRASANLMFWALPIVVSTISISMCSGFLQGSGAILYWKTLLSATSLLQLPIIFAVIRFNLTISQFLFLLSIPGLTFALIVVISHKNFSTVFRGVRISISGSMWPIQFAASSSLLLLLNRMLFGDDAAELVVIMYIFNSISNVAVSLGSSSFSRIFQNKLVGRKTVFIQALVGLLPLGFGISLLIQQSRFQVVLPSLESFRYPPLGDVFALTTNSIVWAILGTILYSRLNLIKRQLVWYGLGFLVLELIIFRYAPIQGLAAIWVHAATGICQLFATVKYLMHKPLFA